MRVTEDRRAPRADEVDVGVAVRVVEVGAFTTDHEAGRSAYGAERADRRVHPTGSDGLRAREQLSGKLVGHRLIFATAPIRPGRDLSQHGRGQAHATGRRV